MLTLTPALLPLALVPVLALALALVPVLPGRPYRPTLWALGSCEDGREADHQTLGGEDKKGVGQEGGRTRGKEIKRGVD